MYLLLMGMSSFVRLDSSFFVMMIASLGKMNLRFSAEEYFAGSLLKINTVMRGIDSMFLLKGYTLINSNLLKQTTKQDHRDCSSNGNSHQ